MNAKSRRRRGCEPRSSPDPSTHPCSPVLPIPLGREVRRPREPVPAAHAPEPPRTLAARYRATVYAQVDAPVWAGIVRRLLAPTDLFSTCTRLEGGENSREKVLMVVGTSPGERLIVEVCNSDASGV